MGDDMWGELNTTDTKMTGGKTNGDDMDNHEMCGKISIA